MSECSHYVLDSAGTRVGCHFDELGEGHTTDDYFFLVNGTSSDSDRTKQNKGSEQDRSLGVVPSADGAGEHQHTDQHADRQAASQEFHLLITVTSVSNL